MRKASLAAALLVMMEMSGVAHAELVGKANERPSFSAAEVTAIVRNEILRDIVAGDPWLVRRILDVIAQAAQTKGSTAPAESPEPIDAARNPDIAAFSRSAESSAEWIALVRRARAEKLQAAAPKRERSFEGSLELIDMMRKAKNEKTTPPAK